MKLSLLVLALLLLVSNAFAQQAAFFELVKTGTPEQIRTALANGAKIDYRTGEDNSTPLMLAAASNPNPEVIAVLLQAGAIIEGEAGKEALLTCAARSNPNPEMITTILKLVGDDGKSDRKKYMALAAAAAYNTPKIVSTLIQAGANQNDNFAHVMNPLLAAVVSILAGLLIWLVASKGLEAMQRSPTFETRMQNLIGAIGEAKTTVYAEGSVYVGGEMWSAYSGQEIPAKTRVRVVRRDGFVLEVEKA